MELYNRSGKSDGLYEGAWWLIFSAIGFGVIFGAAYIGDHAAWIYGVLAVAAGVSVLVWAIWYVVHDAYKRKDRIEAKKSKENDRQWDKRTKV